MATTHHLQTPDVTLAYDVHGPLPTTDGRPPLFMVGAPMCAEGFTTLASRRHSVLQWSATGAADLELIIERRVRGRRFVRIGTVRRTVHVGRGRISLWRKLGTYPITPGTYGVRLKSGATPVRCAPKRFLITIERTGGSR